MSIAYAVRHPERVSHLILYGGFAAGPNKRSNLTAADRERFAAMKTLVKHGRGVDNPAFRQIFTSMMMPTATREQADAFNELQRLSGSPNAPRAIWRRWPISTCANSCLRCRRRRSSYMFATTPSSAEQSGPRTGGGNIGCPVRCAAGQEPCPLGAGPRPGLLLRGIEGLLEDHSLATSVRRRRDDRDIKFDVRSGAIASCSVEAAHPPISAVPRNWTSTPSRQPG